MIGFRGWGMALALAVAMVITNPAGAELQNIEVGGGIVILGEYYMNAGAVGTGERWPAGLLRGRAVGVGTGAGNPIVSGFGFDGDGGDLSLVTQWTRIHFDADFTDNVRAFIELDSVDEWGEDFGSDYVTGVDFRASSGDDIEVYQAFIEADELFGMPLRLRVGRQELRFGSEFLVGGNDGGPAPVWGLSFDAIRLSYAAESYSIDAFMAKLAENFSDFGEDDVDFYGVYGSYTGIENIALDAYWFYLRDDIAIEDVPGASGFLEDLFGVDDYGTTSLHTVGLRAGGARGAWDFEVEAAWQFGGAGSVGARFAPLAYGDDDADFSQWALNLEAGYSFDTAWQPRVYLGYAYLGGEDERDLRLVDLAGWAINPFYTRDASVSFNRLFSNWSYSAILDGTDLSNVQVYRAGVSAAPTEKLELALDLVYMVTDEPFDRPIPLTGGLFTKENDEDLGLELGLSASYQYSDDLYFATGWTHLFVGKGLEQGSFTNLNGLDFNGGSDNEDVDYLWFETGVSF